jgi:hypothetical protein
MSRKPDVHFPAPSLPLDEADEVRACLQQLLGSRLFRGSHRCQALLRYITEQTLAGETSALKERTLGIEVFGRAPDYDTSQDPIVRASAAEIRKKLAQYYQEPGHEAEVRIDLLPGSYIAEFHFKGTADIAPKRPAERYDKRYRLIALGVVGVALLVLGSAVTLRGWRRSDLDLLWAPFLNAQGSVLICVGQPIAYNLRSAQAQDTIQGFDIPQPRPDSAQPQVVQTKDLIILRDRYVALGDAICLVHVTSLLNGYRRPYRIRGERSTSFADLRDTPAVLIAAFDNPWTLSVAGQLRFTFKKDSAHETDMVYDRQHPKNADWKLTGAWPNWDITTDYAIVSRILDTTTDRPVMIAAGITQYGTMAAGEFISNPEYFSEAVRWFPRDWAKKNLQVVLRIPVVHLTPGRPRVLATHVW